MPVSDEKIRDAVRETYGGIARRFAGAPAAEHTARASCCASADESASGSAQSGCCGSLTEATEYTTRTSCCGPAREMAIEKPSRARCCGSANEFALGIAQSSCGGSADESAPGPAQSSCCGSSNGIAQDAVACGARFYSAEELGGLPDSVTDISLGCGNPIAIAGLRPGEVVLDLGSGGGIDCFLAAKQVGPEGRVIGLDMTPDMVHLARRNAKQVGATNVDFRFGEMEDIPLPDSSVDVVISNCVINLSPDKDAVFAEAYRVLRPGGRLSVSDIVVDGDLPPAVRSRLDAWAGCIAGALDESVYLDKIGAAGFERASVLSRVYTPFDAEVCEQKESQVVAARADGQPVDEAQARGFLNEAGISPCELAARVASIRVQAFKPI